MDFCEKNPTKACKQCPFSRQVEPGALGGSPPETYVGQIIGNFWLPCHLHSDFSDPRWGQDISKAQCAGAAVMRANLGIDGRMPAELHKLPAGSDENVFTALWEFIAHHTGLSEAEAREWLKLHPPRLMLMAELLRAKWSIKTRRRERGLR